MIEKWENQNIDVFEWCNKVRLEIEEYSDDEDSDDNSLSYDLFSDALFVGIIPLMVNGKPENVVEIILIEGNHDTTNDRERNVKFIKEFISKELPYLKFLERKDFELRYGFSLRYVFKEENNTEMMQ